jgi:hypothetical protein
MKLTLAEAAMGAGAVLEAPAAWPMRARLLRTATPLTRVLVGHGELFFAVRGERHDGHDFVAGALSSAERLLRSYREHAWQNCPTRRWLTRC